jgi:hypothetical protein
VNKFFEYAGHTSSAKIDVRYKIGTERDGDEDYRDNEASLLVEHGTSDVA